MSDMGAVVKMIWGNEMMEIGPLKTVFSLETIGLLSGFLNKYYQRKGSLAKVHIKASRTHNFS